MEGRVHWWYQWQKRNSQGYEWMREVKSMLPDLLRSIVYHPFRGVARDEPHHESWSLIMIVNLVSYFYPQTVPRVGAGACRYNNTQGSILQANTNYMIPRSLHRISATNVITTSLICGIWQQPFALEKQLFQVPFPVPFPTWFQNCPVTRVVSLFPFFIDLLINTGLFCAFDFGFKISSKRYWDFAANLTLTYSLIRIVDLWKEVLPELREH